MAVINIDLEDGKPPVSFTLKPDDTQRFQAFMQRYNDLEKASKRLADCYPGTIRNLFVDGEPVGQQFLDQFGY